MTRKIRFFFYNFLDAGVSHCLDMCCVDGKHVRVLGKGSIGFDYLKYHLFVLEGGKKFRQTSLKDDLKDVLVEEGIVPSAVILKNTFEHTLEPHSFLMNIRGAMPDNGILYLTVPVTHSILYGILSRFLPGFVSSYWKGFLQHEHVNFFTCDTFDLTIKYAGFEIEKRYYGVNFPFLGWLSRAVKSNLWGYMQKSTRLELQR
jgi:hypothetical protein